jgi:hypothetical protein
LWRRSLEFRASGAVGLRWQAVLGCQIVWNRSTRRGGARGGARQGKPRWVKILLSEITSVQFKSANVITKGYLQVAFKGGSDFLGGLVAAAGNENAVVFTYSQQTAFEGNSDCAK